MRQCPAARGEELARVVAFAGIAPGHVVCDVPSGAGYLAPYAPGARFVHVESAATFARLCKASGAAEVVLSELDAVALRSGSVNRVVSLAALHHVDDKHAFFRESWRVLRASGVLCVADVRRGSPVAAFLDDTVGRHNRLGHVGTYLDSDVEKELEACGFHTTHASTESYPWSFSSLDEMTSFTRGLFGMDGIGTDELAGELDHYLGISQEGDRWMLGWELLFCRGVK